jgi:hypothetical protein
MKHVHRILSFFKGLSDLIFDQIQVVATELILNKWYFLMKPHGVSWLARSCLYFIPNIFQPMGVFFFF